MIQPASKGTEPGAKVNSRRVHEPTGWSGGEPPLDPRQQLAAEALAGKNEALHELLTWPDLEDFIVAHRLAAALALACRRAKIRSYPATFDRELYWATGRNLLVNEEIRKVGQAFGAARLPWVVFKGADLASRVYAHPCERVFTDVDVLVRSDDLGRTLACLGEQGFLDEHERHLDPTALLAGERYVVTAGRGTGLVVELHYRLWGWMPPSMGDAVVDHAEPHPQLGATARRPTLAWTFVLAAVHAWQVVRPRPLAVWWDLERVASAAGNGFAVKVASLAEAWGVSLPVALAARQAEALWGDPTCATISRQLLGALRPAEVLATIPFLRRGENATPLGLLVLARLLARRPSRLGWRSVGQVFWPADETRAKQPPLGPAQTSRLAVTWRSILRAVRQ